MRTCDVFFKINNLLVNILKRTVKVVTMPVGQSLGWLAWPSKSLLAIQEYSGEIFLKADIYSAIFSYITVDVFPVSDSG